MVIYVGCLLFLSHAFTFVGLIDDLGCSLGLPRRQQVEEEDETNNNMRSRAFESQLDLHLLAKVMVLFGGVIACAFYSAIFNFNHQSQKRCKCSPTPKT